MKLMTIIAALMVSTIVFAGHHEPIPASTKPAATTTTTTTTTPTKPADTKAVAVPAKGKEVATPAKEAVKK